MVVRFLQPREGWNCIMQSCPLDVSVEGRVGRWSLPDKAAHTRA